MDIIQPNTTAILKCGSPLVPKAIVKDQTIAIQCTLPESAVHNNLESTGYTLVDAIGAVGFMVALTLVICWLCGTFYTYEETR